MTVKEVAIYLQVNDQTVYRMAQRGEIPAMKVRTAWRFKREAIDRWLDSQLVTGGKCILVVDDDPLTCELFAEQLSDLGHTVSTVLNGAAALKEIEENHFDLIFLDIFMPDISGVEVFKHIKHLDSQAKVVIVTGYPDQHLVQTALAEGPLVMLSKPVSMEDIERVLDLVGK